MLHWTSPWPCFGYHRGAVNFGTRRLTPSAPVTCDSPQEPAQQTHTTPEDDARTHTQMAKTLLGSTRRHCFTLWRAFLFLKFFSLFLPFALFPFFPFFPFRFPHARRCLMLPHVFGLTSSPTFLKHNTRALSHLDDDANTVKKAHLRWLVASLTYARVRFSFENAACKRPTDRIAEDLISTAPMYGTLSIPRAFRRGSDSKGNRSRHRLVQETKDLRASLIHVPSRCLSAQ